jgi:Flp pilus assembly protein CpaB
MWLQLETGADVEGLIVEAYISEASMRGAYLKQTVEANQPIRLNNVIRPGEQGFIVAAMTPGMRAISVSVNQVSGVSGFVSPGDRVDLMLTHEVNDNSDSPILNPRRFTETILTDLKLLAIEQTVDPATGKPVIGQTVTLEVTPTQSEMVALAATMGQISLALRSVPSVELPHGKDEEMISDLAVSPALRDFLIRGTNKDPNLLRRRAELSELSGKGDAVAATVDPPKQVRIYRANQASTVQVRR